MSRHLSIHATVPILEILVSPNDVLELFELLRLNHADISSFDSTFTKSPEIVSINRGTLYAFIEVGLGERLKVSFYEDYSTIGSTFLRIIFNFAHRKDLRILRSRVSIE